MTTKTNTSKWFRILLGLFLITYALNQFLHVIPTSYGLMPENTRHFIDSVAIYLPFLYVFEFIIGLFLIFNKWSAFIIIVLLPLTISFLIFNISNNDMNKIWPTLIVAFLNISLILYNKKKYKPMFS